MYIGAIVEDESDADVLHELTTKILNNNRFTWRQFLARGSAKLKRKCTAAATNLSNSGCTHLVVVHDLDTNDVGDLRRELEKCIEGVKVRSSLILIPIREIEAWLLCDADALRAAFEMKRIPKLPTNPERILDPKKQLERIVKSTSGKQYVNTIHNKRIAAKVRLNKMVACPSFEPYLHFIKAH